MNDKISLDQSYDEFPRIEEEFQQFLDESLDPRGPESLFELLEKFKPPRDGLAIDVGCGEGRRARRLAGRLGLRVLGVDPVQRHIDIATASAKAEGLSETVQFQLGVAEDIPVDDASVDVIWSNETLTYLDLGRAFREFLRVLRPDGIGLVHQVLIGRRTSDEEARSFDSALRPEAVEDALSSAGLQILERVDFASEWGEYAQERTGAGGRRLLHVARLLRTPERYIDRYGEVNYRLMLDDCLWHVYRMIGKLHGVAFVFKRPL